MDEFNKTPLNRREYITANDPRDKIDLYGKKTLIDAKKQNTQQGIVEYHAIVVASTENDLPKNTSFLQNALNLFFGDKSSAPDNELNDMNVVIAYIVGPESKDSGRNQLPHDNIPPPCEVIRNFSALSEETKLSLSLLEKVGSFIVPPNVNTPELGSKIRVSFSQMPTSGVMRGGMYIGPITTRRVAEEMDKKITQKCVGASTGGSATSFASGGTTISVTISSDTEKENIKLAMDILTLDEKCKIFDGENLTIEQAAGVLGNLRAESPRLNSAAFNPGDSPKCKEPEDLYKNSFGLAQWNCERAKRLAEFAEVVPKKNSDIQEIPFDTQVKYICRELSTTETVAAEKLKKAETVEEATEAMFWYERFAGYPGDKNGKKPGDENYNQGQQTMKTRKRYAQESNKIYTQSIVKEALPPTSPKPISSTIEPTSTATNMSVMRHSTPYSKFY